MFFSNTGENNDQDNVPPNISVGLYDRMGRRLPVNLCRACSYQGAWTLMGVIWRWAGGV